MNSEVKKLLIDLIEYYNVMGTESDPGIGTFQNITQRASLALKVQSRLDTLKRARKASQLKD